MSFAQTYAPAPHECSVEGPLACLACNRLRHAAMVATCSPAWIAYLEGEINAGRGVYLRDLTITKRGRIFGMGNAGAQYTGARRTAEMAAAAIAKHAPHLEVPTGPTALESGSTR